MTRTTNARIAGFTYLFYTAVALISMVWFDRASSGEGTAARLASMAQHATGVRVAVVLSLLGCLSALVLAVTLYAVTREQDPDLAMLALICRVAEGIFSSIFIPATLGLLWLATVNGTNASDAATAHAFDAFLLRVPGLSAPLPGTFFALGSTIFSWLLLRSRMIPIGLAALGVVLSAILVIALPLQLAGILGGQIIAVMLMSMLAFEVPLGFWLVIRGVRLPR